jgi:uncharacterized protein (DUF1800 family)
MSLWTPYRPTKTVPWNLARVVHLHRRAGFGATWAEIQRDLADGPEAAVSRVVAGSSRLAGVPAEFESLSAVIGQAAVDSASPERLKAWWLYRCLFSPHPLQERLTLMWHNHFATSNQKVDNLALMQRQNQTLRQHSLSPFGDLLTAMAHDPALLVWLDAPQNRRSHPNENLARELMELFTLGIGNYTESDIKQAARALTGWTVRQNAFVSQPAAHDEGQKEIFGQIGHFGGDELVKLTLDHPATARRLAWRLTSEFCGENVVTTTAIDELANHLRGSQLHIGQCLETILRSELFFNSANIGSRVADPVSFLISPLRALECWRQAPSTLILAEWVSRMGQDLFYPPNVGGWPGGRAWLSTRTTIARANYMAALSSGQLTSPPHQPDIESLVKRHAGADDGPNTTQFLSRLLFGRDMSGGEGTTLELLASPAAHLH